MKMNGNRFRPQVQLALKKIVHKADIKVEREDYVMLSCEGI